MCQGSGRTPPPFLPMSYSSLHRKDLAALLTCANFSIVKLAPRITGSGVSLTSSAARKGRRRVRVVSSAIQKRGGDGDGKSKHNVLI